MATTREHIVGIEELTKKMSGLPRKIAKKIARQALRSGAKYIVADAKARVPVRTGAYRNAIKVRAGKSMKGYVSMYAAADAKWFTGPTFYAGFLEFGWNKAPITRLANGRIVSQKRGSKPTTKMPAKGYMAKSFHATRSKVGDMILSSIADGIAKAAQEKA